MNGIVPPSPKARCRSAERGQRRLLQGGIEPGREGGRVPARPGLPSREGHPGAVGRIGGERRRDGAQRGVGVAGRRDAERELQRGRGPQDVAGAVRRRQPVGTHDAERRPPGVGQDLFDRIVGDGAGVADEVVAVGVCRRRRRCLPGLTAPVVRDRHVELGHPDLAGRGVLHPLEELAGDAERAGHDAAGRPGMDTFLEDVDRQRAAGQASQRRRDPEPVVVVAARVEAHDERRRPDPVGQGLQMGGEVGGAALLARFDEHQAAGVGATSPLDALDGGQRCERRVAVVGATAPVQAVAFHHRRPRPEAVAPAVHLRLLVQVAVEEHGCRRWDRRRRRGCP